MSAPGAVDVVDTASLERVKSIPTKGGIHNVYVTPDGKYLVAGSIAGKLMTVIDQKTDEPVWTLFNEGVRPMAFETNADGSTKRIFVQLSDFHGFAIVDFAQRKEIGARSSCRTIFRPTRWTRGRSTRHRPMASAWRRTAGPSGSRAGPTRASTRTPCRI